MRIRTIARVLAVAAVLAGAAAEARIKLITLPARERVEIQLDHPGRTLVEEERVVPLARGANQVDFSWANTRIDPDSIVFRVIGEGAGEVAVLSVSYPPNEHALVWNVHAERAGAARVRISYLLGNLDKSFNYRAVATRDETALTLSHYVRVRNLSNESFGESEIWIGHGEAMTKPVGIAETRELLVGRYRDVAVTKTYTADLAAFGWLEADEQKLRVAMHYAIANDAAHNLGDAPLPYGKARIFQRDGRGGTAFVGEDWAEFTAPGDEMRLYLGVARDVVVRRVVETSERKRIDGNLFDHEVVLRYEVENFKPEPVTLDVVEDLRRLRAELVGERPHPVQWRLGPATDFPGGIDPERSAAERAVVHAPLPAAGDGGDAGKRIFRLHLVIANEW